MSDTCQNLATQQNLIDLKDEILRLLDDYIRKSELVAEIDRQKDPIVASLMDATTWAELPITINLADHVQTTS